MRFSPPYTLEVTAFVLRDEVNRSLRTIVRLPPQLTKHSDIRIAHQLLPQYMQAMCGVRRTIRLEFSKVPDP